MILYIHGADTFRSRQYLKQSVEQFKTTRDPQGYNVVFLSGKNEESGKILGALVTAPFLAEKRMVIIENVLSTNDKEFLGRLIEKLKTQNVPDSTVAVFWQGEALSKIKEAKELEALLQKEKYARKFELLTGRQLLNWAEATIKERGGTIEPGALEYLCQNAGSDMWRLNSAIDQLVAYVSSPSKGEDRGGGLSPITLADTALFLEEKIDDNIFNLVEAIVAGNKKQAYKLLLEQRRLGEEESKIFGLLVWQFRILLEMADALERESQLTSQELAKKIGIHPFVAKKNLAAARQTPLSKLQALHRSLLDLDIKTKTGVAPQDLLIDLFIAQV